MVDSAVWPTTQCSRDQGIIRTFARTISAILFLFASAMAQAQTQNLVGIWWNPAESGWGLSIQQQGTRAFAVWYTYGVQGAPTWYTLDCAFSANVCAGTLYTATGTPLPQLIGPANIAAAAAGTGAVTITAANRISLSYTIGGVTQTKAALEPQNFGASDQVPVCTLETSTDPGFRAGLANYTDHWWGGPFNSGWGIQISHQGDTVFLAWFHYDEVGRASWMTGVGKHDGINTRRFAGTLYRIPAGIAFSQIAGPIPVSAVTIVGTFDLDFSDGERGSLTHNFAALGIPARTLPLERFAIATGAVNMCRVGAPAAASPDRPRGLFALTGISVSDVQRAANLDYIEGVTLRNAWSKMEPAAGQYDFSSIDTVIGALLPSGKKLNLEIIAVDSPAHLLAQIPAAETWQAALPGQRNGATAVPWNQTAQAAWRAFCVALANHPVALTSGARVRLTDHPALMMTDAPIVGLQGIRDLTNALVAHPGYTRQKFVDATAQSVHAMRGVFPAKFGFLSFFSMSDADRTNPLDTALMDRLMREFNNPGQATLGFFQENLSDAGPNPAGLGRSMASVKDRAYIVFQALTAWSQPFTGENNVTSGKAVTGIEFAYRNYGTTYVEIYTADVHDPAQTADLRRWNQILVGAPFRP